MTADVEPGGDSDRESPWTVSYRPEPADLLASYRAASRPRFRRYGPAATLVCVAIGALLGRAAGQAGPGWPSLGAAAGAILGATGFVAMFLLSERRILSEENVAAFCVPQTMTIGPDGFEHAREDGGGLSASWKEVLKVGTTRSDFVIFLDESRALAVPLRAFRSEGQRDLFVNFAGAWHAEATKAGDAAPRGPDQRDFPSSPS